MKPNGVIGTIQGLLELGDISPDMWQRCDSLACIISTPPGREEAKHRAYYSIIGPQLLELVQRSSKVRMLLPFKWFLLFNCALTFRIFLMGRLCVSLPGAIET